MYILIIRAGSRGGRAKHAIAPGGKLAGAGPAHNYVMYKPALLIASFTVYYNYQTFHIWFFLLSEVIYWSP